MAYVSTNQQPVASLGVVCGEGMQWYEGECRSDDEIAAILGILCPGGSTEYGGECLTPSQIEERRSQTSGGGGKQTGATSSRPDVAETLSSSNARLVITGVAISVAVGWAISRRR